MLHHTKDKGDLALMYAQLRLTEMGYFILLPVSEHLPFDLIAYKDGKCLRIQVKYKAAKKNKISITFRSSWADKNGSHTKYIDKSQIDYWCIFCPDTKKMLFY